MKLFYNDIMISTYHVRTAKNRESAKETENLKISKESYPTKKGVIGPKRWYVSGMVPLQTIRIQL